MTHPVIVLVAGVTAIVFLHFFFTLIRLLFLLSRDE
jgi:hypothetical protein